jgi:hypothetical protein
LLGGLEHLKIETRLIDESFASVMGAYGFAWKSVLSDFVLFIMKRKLI